jgi:hypothetical protein
MPELYLFALPRPEKYGRRGGQRSRASEPSYTLACFARMNQHAEACLRNALEYERAAELAADALVRRMYLDLARQWRDWAEQAERQAGKDLPLSAA